MGTDTPKAVEIFFSYAHEDEDLRGKLARHLSILQRQKVITDWNDREISAGTEWQGEIDQHLNKADIILLLISADFLASDYCYDVELKRAMERHEKREAPVILRSVDWHGAPFGKLKPLPKNGKPVTSWENLDEAFLNITQGIRTAVEQLPPDQRSFDRAVSDTQSAISQPQPPLHKNKLLAVAAFFLLGAVGYPIYQSLNNPMSEREINYTQLQDLLKKRNWKEADAETTDIMLKVSGRAEGSVEERWLRKEDFKNFPCQDLVTIDRLWVKYSDKRFGFSVQQTIWRKLDGDWKRYLDMVGGQESDGYYPQLSWPAGVAEPGWLETNFARLDICKDRLNIQ